MIDLHIHTSTPDELVQTLRLLSGVAAVGGITGSTAVKVEGSTAPDTPWGDSVSELPAREEAVEAPVTDAPTEEPAAKAAEQPKPGQNDEQPTLEPTMEEARAALNNLRERKGSAAVRALLNKHKVSSFIDLTPDQYPTIIKEAKDYE